MTNKNLLSQALDALETNQCAVADAAPHADVMAYNDAITALREALAQPAPEPVAWRYQDEKGHYRYQNYVAGFDVEYAILQPVPLYAAPPAAPMPEPSDMVIVPREPTQEMIEAADQSDKEYSLRAFGPGTVLAQSGYDHWVAMIAAAPPAAPEECDMADDGGCPVCGEDGGTSCGMPNCGLLQGAAPATSADYAMGYAEGFNDACKPAPVVPDDAALNTLAKMFHNGEEIEGDDGAAMMVDMALWNEACEAFESLIGDGDSETLALSAAPVVREPIIDEMDAVASRYAHKLALDLECVLSDYNGKWWDTAMQTIGEYRMAMNRIHERESPTHMGDPVLPKIGITGESNEI